METGSDFYLTVAAETEVQLKVRRSWFLARVRETAGEARAREFVRQVQQEHSSATHNCWAFRLGLSSPFADAWNDDGEPEGTAGRPIHGAITRTGLTNVTVVVTRYFGGKKLGIRGLIETYGEAAQAAVDKAGFARRRLHRLLTVDCNYSQLGELQGLLASAQGSVAQADYGERVTLQLLVPRAGETKLKEQLQELGIEARGGSPEE